MDTKKGVFIVREIDKRDENGMCIGDCNVCDNVGCMKHPETHSDCEKIISCEVLNTAIEAFYSFYDDQDKEDSRKIPYWSGCNFNINTGKHEHEPNGTAQSIHDCNGCEKVYECDLKKTTPIWVREEDGFKPDDTFIAQELNRRIVRHSTDKYNHVRTLKLVEVISGYCEEVYKSKENNNFLIRQRASDTLVKWLSVNRNAGYYEADTPIKDGLTLNVIDNKGNVLFTETTFYTEWNGGGQADKKYPFSWEL